MKIIITDCLGHYIVWILFIGIFGVACGQDKGADKVNLNKIISSLRQDSLYGLVLTPAGEISKYEWEDSHLSRIDTHYFAQWNYLPWPVNEAILLRKNQPAGTKIPAMIIHERVPFGELLPVRLLGAVSFTIGGQTDFYILLIPSPIQLSPLTIQSFQELNTQYDPLKYQIQQWIIHHQGTGAVQRIQWHNEQYAQLLISQSEVN